MESETEHLFVYGTLKKGCTNPTARYLHSSQEYLGKAYFPGQLFIVSFYPGAIYLPGTEKKVHGDLFKITRQRRKLLSLLDEYEGVDTSMNTSQEFSRQIIPVHHNGKNIPAITYLFNREHSSYPVRESGNFEPQQ